jgi:MerR family transcriptional regulator, copper efflux regulator
MTIGQIAKLSSVSKDTLRLYTEKGLIEGAMMQAGSRLYADYDIAVVEQVKAIKNVQALGFTLSEIKLLLDEVGEECELTPKQLSLLGVKLEEISAKQRQLRELASFVKQKIREHS